MKQNQVRTAYPFNRSEAYLTKFPPDTPRYRPYHRFPMNLLNINSLGRLESDCGSSQRLKRRYSLSTPPISFQNPFFQRSLSFILSISLVFCLYRNIPGATTKHCSFLILFYVILSSFRRHVVQQFCGSTSHERVSHAEWFVSPLY